MVSKLSQQFYLLYFFILIKVDHRYEFSMCVFSGSMIQREAAQIWIQPMDRNTIFRPKELGGTYPGLHFHCLVQEDCGKGDSVDGCPKGKNINIRVLVGLQSRNKQALSAAPMDWRPWFGQVIAKHQWRQVSREGKEWGEAVQLPSCGTDCRDRQEEEWVDRTKLSKMHLQRKPRRVSQSFAEWVNKKLST